MRHLDRSGPGCIVVNVGVTIVDRGSGTIVVSLHVWITPLGHDNWCQFIRHFFVVHAINRH